MIKLTVNTGTAPTSQEFEFDYEVPRGALGEAVAAAKLLHHDWTSIVAVLTRPKADAMTGAE